MCNKLVVYFDEFYPAAKVHLDTLRAAVAACGAEGGVFAPTSYEAIRKISGEHLRNRLPGNAVRVELLEALIAGDAALRVERSFMESRDTHVSPRLLGALRSRYPGVRLVIAITLQQLYVLSKRPERETLIERFGFVVLRREEDDVERAFERSEWLQEHRAAFCVAEAPFLPTAESKAALREAVFAGDEGVSALLGEEALGVLRRHGYFGSRRIDSFRGEYRFLSNFYPVDVFFDGILFDNSEAAYQAQKCCSVYERVRFEALEPLEAKDLGAVTLLREDWEEVRLDVMENVLRAKFGQNPEVKALLVATGDAVLVEGNTWGDRYWGVDVRSGEGENHLGRLLEKLRSEYAQETE